VTLMSPFLKESFADFIQHHRFAVDSTKLDDGGWIFRDTRGEDVIIKMRKSGIPLEEFVMGQVYEGIEIGSDKPLIINKKVKEQLVGENPACESLIRPFVTGKGIARYRITANHKYLVYPRKGSARDETSVSGLYRWMKKRYPAIARSGKFLMKNIEVTGPVGDTRGGMLNDSDFWKNANPKIFFRKRFKKPAFAFDKGRTIADNTTGAISSSSRYLLGLLNSRLMAFLFKNSRQTSGAEQKLHSWDDLRNLPVYTIDFDNPVDKIRHDRMDVLVSVMLELYKHLSQAKTEKEKHLITQEIESIDRQIDSLVYGLYGLTADEVAIVEESESK
jgi:TaqI-like C-terminal specificity domain